MSAINTDFLSKLHELSTIAFNAGIHCPQLVELYDWTMKQNAATTIAGARANPTASNEDFNDALLAAIKSSPNGVDMNDLRSILAPYGRAPNQIGLAAGRFVKAGEIEKRGNQWFGKGDDGTKIDRSLTRRARKAAQPAAANEGQQQTGTD